jgi:hypothetical protein
MAKITLDLTWVEDVEQLNNLKVSEVVSSMVQALLLQVLKAGVLLQIMSWSGKVQDHLSRRKPRP